MPASIRGVCAAACALAAMVSPVFSALSLGAPSAARRMEATAGREWIASTARHRQASSNSDVGASVRYELTPHIDSGSGRLDVSMTFDVVGPAQRLDLQMPAWSPGDYRVQNHARWVRKLRVWEETSGGRRSLPVTRPDAATWETTTAGTGAITVSYELPNTPAGFFSQNVQLRRRQIFLNGPAVYCYVVGRKDNPALLTLHTPAGWRTETALTPGNSPDADAQRFTAPDYDTLADSPIEMAAPDSILTRDFAVDGNNYKIVEFGDIGHAPDLDTLMPMMARVVKAETAIMGGMPARSYRFFFDVAGVGGGLEHLNCCRIAIWPDATPDAIAALVAHEFFHLWNVKRIRPQVLGPFDYVDPPRTRNLWFAEGVTEYYAWVALRRAGILTAEQFFGHWASAITALERDPERKRISADEASLRVWESGNSEGFGISYYVKGELIGLCLDLKLRHVTQSRVSLDDVMRSLLRKYGSPSAGYGEDDLRKEISDAAGQDLSAFYDQLARSTDEMPLAECLGYVGLDGGARPIKDAAAEQVALRNLWDTESIGSD